MELRLYDTLEQSSARDPSLDTLDCILFGETFLLHISGDQDWDLVDMGLLGTERMFLEYEVDDKDDEDDDEGDAHCEEGDK